MTLLMTEIEVPEEIQRFILCEKHEPFIPPKSSLGLACYSTGFYTVLCKHCRKPLGLIDEYQNWWNDL